MMCRLIPVCVMAILLPCVTHAQTDRAPADARGAGNTDIRIYVSPPTRDGNVDVDRGILDSVEDIRKELTAKNFVVVATPYDATLTLTVVARRVSGFNGLAGSDISNWSGPSHRYEIDTVLRFGQVEYRTTSGDERYETWRAAAKEVAKDVAAWIDANRQTLSKAGAPCVTDAQKDPAVDDVLRAAADYLVKYSQQIGVIAAEEEFRQSFGRGGRYPVRLVNDVVVFANGLGQARTYRDVAVRGGKPVRVRDDRLFALMKVQDSDRISRADELTEAAVRHYITPDLHGLDDPFLALEFLRKDNQSRSTFRIAGVTDMDGARVAVLKFAEEATPRVIPSPENPPAIGTFWIDVDTGTVRRTELSLSGHLFDFHCVVRYARNTVLDLWLPSGLDQDIRHSRPDYGLNEMSFNVGYRGTITAEGHSTFTEYRR